MAEHEQVPGAQDVSDLAIGVRKIRYLREKRILQIEFSDDKQAQYSAEYLRLESPSAELKAHAASAGQPIGDKSAVQILAIEPVGHYAIRLVFDDGHNTGIYSWRYLRQLAAKQAI